MSLDGGDLRAVTHEGLIALAPSWSPDSRSLLLTSYRTGNPSLFEIDVAGGPPRLVSAQRGLNLGGRFSPGGRAIAVALESGGQTDIALLDPSGQLIRWVTRDRALDVSPSWSPDGRSLVFCSDRGGGPQIYTVSADGGEPHRMSYSGNYNTSPSWSPKGDRIAYAHRATLPGVRHRREGRRREAGHEQPRRQRGSVVVARRTLPRVQLHARRFGRDLHVRRERRAPEKIDPTGGR